MLRRLTTPELDARLVREIRSVVWAAFERYGRGDFTEDDWQHALGGMHFVLEIDGRVAGHASVVERRLEIAGRPLRTGYVEAVAVDPAHQGHGHGTTLMRAVNDFVEANFELGALGTGSHHFYERLGWRTWRGPSGVRTSNGLQATPDEDGYILVLSTPSSPPLRLTDPISCEWRAGDVW
jgi:aminoglycoside 2'-N-acetyltransferase I